MAEAEGIHVVEGGAGGSYVRGEIDRRIFEHGERVHSYELTDRDELRMRRSGEIVGKLVPLGEYAVSGKGGRLRRRVLAVRAAPRRRGGGGSGGPTLLYAHSNGHDLGTLLWTSLLQTLADASGCEVFAFEFPGYGPADPSEVSSEDAVRAMIAAYGAVIDAVGRRSRGAGSKPADVLFAGFSMGTGVAVEATRRLIAGGSLRPPAGLFLEGAYASLFKTSSGRRPYGLPGVRHAMRALGAPFNTLRTLGKPTFTVPIWVVHGEDDRTCPVKGARRIAALPVCEASLFIPRRRHTGLPEDERFTAFLRAFCVGRG